jgi:cbb3-type cytochrome oxidase cytochrome c subunit
MKHAGVLLLTGFGAMAVSWASLILVPQLQLGRADMAPVTGGTDLYPQPRPGLATRGAEVYRANGCHYCHSRQVQQEGVAVDVVFTEVGTNQAAVLDAFKALGLNLADNPLTGLPRDLMREVSKERAETAEKTLADAGAKSLVRIRATGPDMERGWGQRGSVARDYLQDRSVLLGSVRLGPDLANIGVRQPDPAWHLRHLYAPGEVVKGSTMPPYRFLFEERRIQQAPARDALQLPEALAPGEGLEIVPTDDARALVAYLLSLRSDVPLFEAPFTGGATMAAASTNNVAP